MWTKLFTGKNNMAKKFQHEGKFILLYNALVFSPLIFQLARIFIVSTLAQKICYLNNRSRLIFCGRLSFFQK